MMIWRKFDATGINGTFARGDKTVPPTTMLNYLFLMLFVWKKATVFMVPDGIASYRVGSKSCDGSSARLRPEPMTVKKFAVKNGYEDQLYFAIDHEGREVILLPIEQISTDSLPASIPLI